jgi:hypothetical protein
MSAPLYESSCEMIYTTSMTAHLADISCIISCTYSHEHSFSIFIYGSTALWTLAA